MRSTLKVLVCAITLIAMGGLAFANFATTDDAISYRKAVMTILGKHFGSIAQVVTGQPPLKSEALSKDTLVLRTMADLAWEACLMPGSQKGRTTLKKTVMDEKDAFMALARQFEVQTNKFDETVKSGDSDSIKAQFGEIAKSCKECHMTYRKR